MYHYIIFWYQVQELANRAEETVEHILSLYEASQSSIPKVSDYPQT